MKRHLLSLAKRITRVFMRSDRVWEIARNMPGKNFFSQQRSPVIAKRAARQCKNLFVQQEVLTGPFAGMQYANPAAVGSVLWPKLLGTYESELRPCFDSVAKKKDYDRIVDIGFAEGYYLVGLGRIFRDAELVGFDVEDEAKQLCRANAELNGIEESRLKLFGGFEPNQFRETLSDQSLVVVDCEGYENDVIECLSSDDLQKSDWIVETHDHLVSGTTERIKLAFQDTHDVVEVTTDTNLENKTCLLPESVKNEHNHYLQEAMVDECRKAKQSWIYATRKAAA